MPIGLAKAFVPIANWLSKSYRAVPIVLAEAVVHASDARGLAEGSKHLLLLHGDVEIGTAKEVPHSLQPPLMIMYLRHHLSYDFPLLFFYTLHDIQLGPLNVDLEQVNDRNAFRMDHARRRSQLALERDVVRSPSGVKALHERGATRVYQSQ